jgi:trigger factor
MFGFGKKKKESEAGAAEEPAQSQSPASSTSSTAVMDAPAALEGVKVKIKKREDCVVTASVTVGKKEVEEAVEKAFRTVQARAKMPGFRAGKVPMDIVKKNFDGHAREEALDKLLRASVFQALQEEKLQAVATPSITEMDYKPGTALKYEFTVECEPDIELKKYKGFALKKKIKTFTDADVDKSVDSLREGNARLVESKDAEVSMKHCVVVDSVALDGDKPLEDTRAQDQIVDMASPQSLPGLSEKLVGAKAGEKRVFPIDFPADHPNPQFAGKPVTFEVTVKTIKEKQLPAADDEFAKDLGVESLAALKVKIKESLDKEFQKGSRADLEKQVTEELLKEHIFAVPPSLLKERIGQLNEHLKNYLMQRGASDADWAANEAKMGDKNKGEAERQLRLGYILSAVAKEEKIDVTKEDLNAHVQKILDGVEPAQRARAKELLEKQKSSLYSQLLEEKIYNDIIKNARVEEVAG